MYFIIGGLFYNTMPNYNAPDDINNYIIIINWSKHGKQVQRLYSSINKALPKVMMYLG